MNTQELARRVAESEKVPAAVVQRLIDAMAEDVERVVAGGGLVRWPKFGTFYARYKKPRLYRTQEARKRPNRPGEGADKFLSISLQKWVFVFSPSRYLMASVRGGVGMPKPKTQYEGIGSDFNKRMAAAVELSTVEVAALINAIVAAMSKELATGLDVWFGSVGKFYAGRRFQRYVEVNKAGGGRQKILSPSRTLPRLQRQAKPGGAA